MYFVIEGIDRAGKTTVIEELKKLEPFASQTKFVQEPFNKKLFEGVDPEDWRKNTLLFTSQRTGLNKLIRTNLRVVSDRSFISNLAYQGTSKSRREWILQVNNFVYVPNMVFILDLSPEEALERTGARDELSDFENVEFLKGVRERYLHVIDLKTSQFHVLNALESPESIAKSIVDAIKGFEYHYQLQAMEKVGKVL